MSDINNHIFTQGQVPALFLAQPVTNRTMTELQIFHLFSQQQKITKVNFTKWNVDFFLAKKCFLFSIFATEKERTTTDVPERCHSQHDFKNNKKTQDVFNEYLFVAISSISISTYKN